MRLFFGRLKQLIRGDAASGLILVIAALLAMIVANSPLTWLYDSLVSLPFEIRLGAFSLAKPVLLWINDGLMAIFFLMIGLELKREIVSGHLSDIRQVALPALGAVGGMTLPAALYFGMNAGDPVALRGWAIPAATDIAFALGVLALLGDRVPPALKIFLASIAIFDDIGAIIIIAAFYSGDLSGGALAVAAACLPVLFLMNRMRIMEKTPYAIVGLVMWIAVLKSGVHATLAGVCLALFIPMRDPDVARSPLHELEHDLHFSVSFLILPVFAFANAGITLSGVTPGSLLHPVPLGIALGLFAGKQLGVFAMCWLGVKLGLARLPAALRWSHVYAVGLLCGIGFTMSLFISSLAFAETGVNRFVDERLGILIGSTLSGVCGFLLLHRVLPGESTATSGADASARVGGG